jgi:type II secretory pathway pseudopilin PulG
MLSTSSILLCSLLPLLVRAGYGDSVPEGGAGSTQSPTEAGASGNDTGAFTLSKGALIAIIIVVAVVVVLGAASLTLWYIAKKRQWEVRASIRRASRRLTGRAVGGPNNRASRANNRQNRRTGIRMESSPLRNTISANKIRDVEKGFATPPSSLSNSAMKNTSNEKMKSKTVTTESAFEAETPKVKSYREKFVATMGKR